MGFPGGASGKEPACHCRKRETWIRSLGQEDPLEEGLENPMNREAWWATDHGVAKSPTQLKRLNIQAPTHMHIISYSIHVRGNTCRMSGRAVTVLGAQKRERGDITVASEGKEIVRCSLCSLYLAIFQFVSWVCTDALCYPCCEDGWFRHIFCYSS